MQHAEPRVRSRINQQTQTRWHALARAFAEKWFMCVTGHRARERARAHATASTRTHARPPARIHDTRYTRLSNSARPHDGMFLRVSAVRCVGVYVLRELHTRVDLKQRCNTNITAAERRDNNNTHKKTYSAEREAFVERDAAPPRGVSPGPRVKAQTLICRTGTKQINT